MTKQEKAQILHAIKIADDNALKEQDMHRDRIKAMETIGNKDYLKKPPSMKWKGVAKLMSDECWPATYKEREDFLGQNWDEIPSRLQIDQIEDSDIRSRTYFLGEVIEQCQRIKAHAKFNEILGSHPRDPFANLLYGIWTMHSFCTQFSKEQFDTGNDEKGQEMLQLAEVMGEFFELLTKDSEIPEGLPSNKGELATP